MVEVCLRYNSIYPFDTCRPNRVDAARDYLATQIADDGDEDEQEDEAVRTEAYFLQDQHQPVCITLGICILLQTQMLPRDNTASKLSPGYLCYSCCRCALPAHPRASFVSV